MRDQLRYALLIASVVSGLAVFVAFTFYEEPGLGLGHFYYVSIILAALATGPVIGATAAGVATGMFAAGVLINPRIPPSEVLTTSTGIRFLTYMTVGVVTGYFAKRNRILMADLALLAERDALTGLPNTRAFERAIGERLAREQPFGLIVGDVDALTTGSAGEKLHADDVLREVAARLQRSLLRDPVPQARSPVSAVGRRSIRRASPSRSGRTRRRARLRARQPEARRRARPLPPGPRPSPRAMTSSPRSRPTDPPRIRPRRERRRLGTRKQPAAAGHRAEAPDPASPSFRSACPAVEAVNKVDRITP